MDEKLVEQISTDTGVPQELVSRSAQARAQANGVDVNAILASWSSGEAPAVSSAPVETVVEEAPVETVVEEAPVETVVEEAPVETVVEEAPVETVIEEAPVETVLSYVDEDIPPPAQLSVKIFRALQYGTVFGIVAGFIQAFIVSSYLYEGLILESETLNLIANYTPTQYILNIALTTTFFAVISSINLKKILEKNYEGFGILTNDRESLFLGVGLGLIFGSSIGFVITSDIGVTIEAILEDDVTTYLIPVIGSFWRIVLFSTVSQAIIASIVIVLGIPKGLDLYELKEANVIRNRVTGSIVIPLGAILFGGVISVLISQVFINFHDYAPLFALIISAAILLFASVMSSAPKIKITRNEVLIAAAGVITLTVIIASVAASQN
jgi:hypothetical protein